jgi:hypothetical protein
MTVILDGFQTGPGSKDQPAVIHVLPKTATIHRNGYQQADSWELEFDYMDLPFDPQLVSAGSIEIYLYDANGLNAETAMLSRQFAQTSSAIRGPDSTDIAAVDIGVAAKDAFTEHNKPDIAGLFDDHSFEFDDSGKWVTLQGQDFTALLIGEQWKPHPNGRARRIPVGQRLDRWAMAILSEGDTAGHLGVVIKDVDPSKLPIVGAAEVANHARGIPVQQNTSYWDVIYKTVTRYGFICYIDGLDLIITKPKNLDDIATHDIKNMAWGSNLSNLRFTRHLGKVKVPRVIIMAYNDAAKNASDRLIRIEEPDNAPAHKEAVMAKTPSKRVSSTETIKAATAHKASTAKSPKTRAVKISDEFMIIPVYGVTDKDALRQAARMMRTLIGRGERTVVATTRDLVDLDGKGILKLSSGDAVQIHWQDFNQEILGNPAIPAATRVKHLVDRGFQEEVAQVIATGYEILASKQRPLRLREATIEYGEDGIKIEMELVDFVQVDGVRDQATMQPRKQLDAILKLVGGDFQ